jgi:hypothetical protein
MNPMRDLEYPFALGAIDTSTVEIKPKKGVPAEHALEKDGVLDPLDGRVDPRDRPKSTFDGPDDIDVDVI